MSGKLSSSVKNMKFMRFAEGEEENYSDLSLEKSTTPEPKYVHDTSSWSLQDAKQKQKKTQDETDKSQKKTVTRRVVKVKRQATRPITVGVTTINRINNQTSIVRGRRVVDTVEGTEDVSKKRKEDSPKDDDEDSYNPLNPGLDALLKQGRKKSRYNPN